MDTFRGRAGTSGSGPTAADEAGSGRDDDWWTVVGERFAFAGTALGRAPSSRGVLLALAIPDHLPPRCLDLGRHLGLR